MQEMSPEAVYFKGNLIRTHVKDGQLWFVLRDLCEALDLGVATHVASRLDKNVRSHALVQSKRGFPLQLTLVNEAGLYTVILTGRKGCNKAFRDWVVFKVLPSLRERDSFEGKEPASQSPFELVRHIFSELEAQL